ncbi:hypothetical protein [Candidatus Chlamydia sanziniae]|uniref:Uncharacterized protein n=1 Tax=Candidatus Chlamydia sanziniae TaxID=1806891 RepID=A0A1A9HWQ7_9CHLA|nr:hypothetical protein [Candidatus Chlamydia sanziniae]ANH78533.1 hypothetical protein Cs308_0362 [Candidatus Chlamydia sanziniae]
MVNPVNPNPIDETRKAPPGDLSARGMQASAASRSEEAQKISEGAEASKVPSVGRWNFLGAARNALMNLLDKITKTTPTSPSKPTAPTFNDYKTQAKSAHETFMTSTSFNEVKAALISLQAAVAKMKSSASTEEEKAAVAKWESTLTQVKQVNTKLQEITKLSENTQALLPTLGTLSSPDLLQAAVLQAQKNTSAAMEKLQAMKKDPSLTPLPAIADAMTKQVETDSNAVVSGAQVVQDAYDAGQGALGTVQQAEVVNTPNNVQLAKDTIQKAEKVITTALSKYPDSPIVRQAQKLLEEAKARIKEVKPSDGSEVPSTGPAGSTTVGSSQQRGSSITETRISMLLSDAESEVASILMQGFRRMIEQFRTQNPDFKATVQELASQVGDVAGQQDTPMAKALTQAQQALQATLAGTTGDQQELTNVLGAIAIAAATSAGASTSVAGTIGSAVKQLYSATFSSKTNYNKTFTTGYQAYQAVNKVYAEANESTQNVISRTAIPSLSTSVPQTQRKEGRGRENLNQRMARDIVGSSRTFGDVYANTLVLQTVLEIIQGNPGANEEEIKQKLTATVTKAPQFGYPHVQLSNAAITNYVTKLESMFTEGSRTLAETKRLSFEERPLFIQQVLVNIGSLFAGYLLQ